MKKFKNNKGITGIDIVVSVTLIIIVLGTTMAVYSSYANKTKEVERTSTATNLAMKVIETLETTDIENINISGTTIINDNDYGIGDIPDGYEVSAKIIESVNPILQNVAFQVDVTVEYSVQGEEKKVTLSTIKKYEEVGEAQAPEMEDETVADCVPVKYDSDKNGYVKTNEKDLEWYSISSKVFPIVVNTGLNDFDINGVIQLKDCSEIYVWIPSYGIYNDKYRFCDEEGKVIQYAKDSNSISKYIMSNNDVNSKVGGYWQRINASEQAIDSSSNIIPEKNLDGTENEEYKTYNILKNNIFTWQ